MRFSKFWKYLAVSLLSLFVLPALTLAQHYKQTNLVSDLPGMAPVQDPHGASFAIWQAKRNPGIGITGVDGTLCRETRTPHEPCQIADGGHPAPVVT